MTDLIEQMQSVLDRCARELAKSPTYAVFPLKIRQKMAMADARVVITAMHYVDGTDEEHAILAGRVLNIDPVCAIEVYEAWLNSILMSEI